jgi:hypothetical protein
MGERKATGLAMQSQVLVQPSLSFSHHPLASRARRKVCWPRPARGGGATREQRSFMARAASPPPWDAPRVRGSGALTLVLVVCEWSGVLKEDDDRQSFGLLIIEALCHALHSTTALGSSDNRTRGRPPARFTHLHDRCRRSADLNHGPPEAQVASPSSLTALHGHSETLCAPPSHQIPSVCAVHGSQGTPRCTSPHLASHATLTRNVIRCDAMPQVPAHGSDICRRQG